MLLQSERDGTFGSCGNGERLILSKRDGRDKVGKEKYRHLQRRMNMKKSGKGSAAISKESWYKKY